MVADRPIAADGDCPLSGSLVTGDEPKTDEADLHIREIEAHGSLFGHDHESGNPKSAQGDAAPEVPSLYADTRTQYRVLHEVMGGRSRRDAGWAGARTSVWLSTLVRVVADA